MNEDLQKLIQLAYSSEEGDSYDADFDEHDCENDFDGNDKYENDFDFPSPQKSDMLDSSQTFDLDKIDSWVETKKRSLSVDAQNNVALNQIKRESFTLKRTSTEELLAGMDEHLTNAGVAPLQLPHSPQAKTKSPLDKPVSASMRLDTVAIFHQARDENKVALETPKQVVEVEAAAEACEEAWGEKKIVLETPLLVVEVEAAAAAEACEEAWDEKKVALESPLLVVEFEAAAAAAAAVACCEQVVTMEASPAKQLSSTGAVSCRNMRHDTVGQVMMLKKNLLLLQQNQTAEPAALREITTRRNLRILQNKNAICKKLVDNSDRAVSRISSLLLKLRNALEIDELNLNHPNEYSYGKLDAHGKLMKPPLTFATNKKLHYFNPNSNTKVSTRQQRKKDKLRSTSRGIRQTRRGVDTHENTDDAGSILLQSQYNNSLRLNCDIRGIVKELRPRSAPPKRREVTIAGRLRPQSASVLRTKQEIKKKQRPKSAVPRGVF